MARRSTSRSGSASRRSGPERGRPRASAIPGDASLIDAIYGLEPVYEPGAGADGPQLGTFVVVGCPYCGERFETHADVSAGAQRYIEDCQVCCRPIEIELATGTDGRLEGVTARRID